ncbi:MAG TPA: patatin-like phospholipase family protein [Bacteroidia bacterium]|nr:patatin-like phospholipase family protein [Bacteroidia bacterium]
MSERNQPLLGILSRAFLPGDQILDPAAFDDILGQAEWIHLRGKELLFTKGEESDSVFVIKSGRLRAVGPDQSGKEMSRDLTAGELLGEMGVISSETRSMTVFAVRDSDLIKLSKSAMEGLMSSHPQLMMGMLETLIERLRGTPSASRQTAPCLAVAVVPLGRSVHCRSLASRLAESLGAMGATLLLDPASVAERSGDALVGWLNEQEANHQFLVYAADFANEEWTRRCIRQADHILLVAEPGDDPEPSPQEIDYLWSDFGPTSARRSLALLHPDGRKRPTGTARWLDRRILHRHYQIRLDREEDFPRLARSIAERGIGLVLGGGGARGFAQIGVIRALRESGIPIDFVGGTSMGSIVAAACAMEWDAPTMSALAREAFVDSKAFSEYTLPLISLLKGRRLERVTRKIFGETQIEDLWIPQFSVSCDLSSSEAVIHRRGPLWRAVRASGSLPGVLAPMLEDGHLLVDGGVLNNLPGDVMRSLSGGPIIVVDVSPSQDLRARCEQVPTPWQILRNRFLSRPSPGMPGIVDILMRATTLTSVRVAGDVRRDADLYLHPPIEGYGMLEFDAIDRIVADGYGYAMRRIEELGGPAQVMALLSHTPPLA